MFTTYQTISDIQYSPNISRFYYYKSSIEIIKQFPIFGCGTNSWSSLNPQYNGDQYSDKYLSSFADLNPHNEFLKTLSENGVVGFLIFASVFISFFALKKDWGNPLIVSAYLSMTGIIIISYFAFPMNNIPLLIIFAFNLGVVSTQTISGDFLKNKIVLTFLSILVIFVLLFYIKKNYNEMNYIEAIQYKTNSNYDLSLQKLNNISKFIYPEDPNKMPVDYYRGIAQFMNNDFESSLLSFEDALKLEAYNPLILGNKATALFALKRFEECEKLLLEIKKIFPYYFEPQINLLALYANTGNNIETIKLLKDLEWIDVASFKPKNINVYYKIKNDFYEKN